MRISLWGTWPTHPKRPVVPAVLNTSKILTFLPLAIEKTGIPAWRKKLSISQDQKNSKP
jgi:hypothetical protein